jgi:quercetin dioxygenase-like cupin family protein
MTTTFAPSHTAAATTDNVTIIRHPAEAHWLDGDLAELLVTAEQTGGKYDVIRTTIRPGGGPPPHAHSREDEMFYIVRGAFQFVFNDRAFTAGAGECVFLPRGSVHTFKNVGETAGELIVVTTPSGFAEFVADAGIPAVDRVEPPPATPSAIILLAEMADRYGIEIVPAWQPARTDSPLITGRDLWVMGLHVRTLLGNPETNGQFAVAEIVAHPGDFVPPHTHRLEDEMFYVIEGTVEFDLPGGLVTAHAGTFVHIPKQTFHGFRNAGTSDVKMLDFHTPGGFEEFFARVGIDWPDRTVKPADANADVERFVRIATAHGMTLRE